MIKFNRPTFKHRDAAEFSSRGIDPSNELRDKVRSDFDIWNLCESEYRDAAKNGELYQINPLPRRAGSNALALEDFTKGELISLYDEYFVDPDKPGREIYDSIMSAAMDRCPYCGGIGTPKNLDHYLPKSRYPQFAILPYNLIPACRDCNFDGKSSQIATQKGEQVLQPYLDCEMFFREQWIHADYIPGSGNDKGEIRYYVRPPENWSDDDKRRVACHFDNFDISRKYSREAGVRLGIYSDQIARLLLLGISINAAKETILLPIIRKAKFANEWERVMCLALMRDFGDDQ